MKVKICGVDYTVRESEDIFNADSIHFGKVDYTKSEIWINSEMSKSAKNETLCHEITHAMLVYIGRQDLSQDEQFVQAMGNAISQTFLPRVYDEEKDAILCGL